MDSPRLSVLMITHNHAQYLPEAIQSILGQSFVDFEFIIVDDGSIDETPHILDHFARRDARIVIIRNAQNLGRAGARNRALKAKPRGEFIAIMDSDDISLPERFERQISFLDAHSDVVVLGTQVMNVDEQNNPTPEQTRLPETHGSLVWTLLYSVPFANPTVMIRANAVWQLNGYQEGSAVEDAELWSRLVYFGRFQNLPEVLLHYRMPSERLIRRMADWSSSLREVSRVFVENLVGESIQIEMSTHLHHSMIHNPDLVLTQDEQLQIIELIYNIFRSMQAKCLLQEHDIEEVVTIILDQIRMLLGYTPSIFD